MHPCCAPMVPQALTQRAVARDGDVARLARVLAKLRAGQPLTIVAVGGSISTSEYAYGRGAPPSQ